MEEGTDPDSALLSEAIVVWIGRVGYLDGGESALIDRFGRDMAIKLVPRIRTLKDEFFSSDAAHTVAGLREMAEVAASQFRLKHPEIWEEAIRQLANAYAFAWK